MIGELPAYLAVSAIVIVTPGQDTLLTVRNTLLGGRRSGLLTALGVASGQAIWALATSVGLATLIRASEPAFTALKLVGAAYLCYLGVQALLAALRGERVTAAAGETGRRGRPAAALRQGIISNLGNPKMAVFFPSLLPQFVPERDASFLLLLALGLLFALMTLAWLVGYAIAVARAGDLLRRSRVRRALDGLSGIVFLAFGIRLATAHR